VPKGLVALVALSKRRGTSGEEMPREEMPREEMRPMLLQSRRGISSSRCGISSSRRGVLDALGLGIEASTLVTESRIISFALSGIPRALATPCLNNAQ
jgi:hypothetical protein